MIPESFECSTGIIKASSTTWMRFSKSAKEIGLSNRCVSVQIGGENNLKFRFKYNLKSFFISLQGFNGACISICNHLLPLGASCFPEHLSKTNKCDLW